MIENNSGCPLMAKVNFGDAIMDLHFLVSVRITGLQYSRTNGSAQPSEAR